MDYSPEFEEAWKAYPRRDLPAPKKPAFKAWKARLREGCSPDELAAAVRGYAAYIRRKGSEGTEFVMHPATFFGPNERYVPYIPAPEKPIVAAPKPKPETIEERIDAREWIKDLLANLGRAKTSPTAAYIRSKG